MKLWTVQPLFIYEQLKNKQNYHCDDLLCPWKNIDKSQQAYQWMAEQMKKRVSPPPKDIKFPVWAWHTINWKYKTPDLRSGMFRNFKEPHVCIELEIPDQEVLLSDFSTWQRVLDDQYIDFSFSEEEYQKMRDKYELLSPEEQQKVKQQSWENVFFLMPHQNGWIRIGKYVQATFWELKPEYIKSVRYIKEKK